MTRRFDCADPAERAAGLSAAVRAVRQGRLVVLPTDTVYGVGVDAFDPAAVDKLLTAKQRGRDVPLPVLIGSVAALHGLVDVVPPSALRLVEAFWPGPLTVVCKHASSLAWDLGDSRGTVAVRMPLHPVALELLAQTGPLAVTGAMRAGLPAPSTPDEVLDRLDGVDVLLDAGPALSDAVSTVVDVTGGTPRLLRLGALAVDRLQSVVPEIVVS